MKFAPARIGALFSPAKRLLNKMRRFFIENEIPENGTVTVSGDEAKHILTVLRMKCGDELILINGSGTEASAVISSVSNDSVTLDIKSSSICDAEPLNKVTLFQCLPKSGKMEFIIQKCVELGIYEIRTVYTKRCVVKPERNDNKTIRYNRVSHEAAKQCSRAIAPEVHPTVPLKNCDLESFDLVLIAYEDEDETQLKSVLQSCKKNSTAGMKIAIFIGPEGGFEPEEVDFIKSLNQNSYSVSLGKRILRTETAGMAMLAMMMYELEG